MSEAVTKAASVPKVVTPPPPSSPPSSPPPPPAGEQSDSKSQELSMVVESGGTASDTDTEEPTKTTAVGENVEEEISNGDAVGVKEEEPTTEEKVPVEAEEEQQAAAELEPAVEDKIVEKEEPTAVVKEDIVEKEEPTADKLVSLVKEETFEKEELVHQKTEAPVEEEVVLKEENVEKDEQAEEKIQSPLEEETAEKEELAEEKIESPVEEESAEKEEVVVQKVEAPVDKEIGEKEVLVEEKIEAPVKHEIVEKEIPLTGETETNIEDMHVEEEEPVMEEPGVVAEKEDVAEKSEDQAADDVVTSAANNSFEEESELEEDTMEDITPVMAGEEENVTPVEASMPRSTNYVPEPSIYPVLFSPIDNEARSASHKKLRAYESRRRAAYGSKLNSSSLYWRSFRELMRTSLLETKRAERILLARVVASEQFAEHMGAIRDDMLDMTGRPITDPKKKKKILYARMKEHELRDSVATSSNTAANTNIKKDIASSTNTSINSSFKLGDSDDMLDGQHGSMLKSLIDSHSLLAARYNECTTVVTEQVTGEMTNLREQLEDKITTMEVLGDAILDELEAAENVVVEAWEKYYVESSKNIEGQGSDTVEAFSARRVGASFNDIDIKPQKNCTDTWMHEMHYRMAVAYLSACWEKCSAELSRLFTSLKSTEVSRRHRMRGLLIIFLEKEESLWMGLPSTIAPVLKGIVERPMDRNVIEDNVQNSIKVRAQAIQRVELLEKRKLPNGPGLSSNLAKDGNFELSSPLVSDLLCMGKVVEKKDSGYMKSWKTVLAIVTADSFLHLFEIPTALRVQSGTASEVAFHALVPPVEIPTVQNIKTGFAPKAWNLNLAPSDSLVLPNCKIVFNDDGKNTAFEVYETVFKKGARSILGTTGQKKTYFRTRSYEETIEWIGALQARK